MATAKVPLELSKKPDDKPVWRIEKVQISGGFLPGLDLDLSPGLHVHYWP
jgi:hypothetical protein